MGPWKALLAQFRVAVYHKGPMFKKNIPNVQKERGVGGGVKGVLNDVEKNFNVQGWCTEGSLKVEMTRCKKSSKPE